MNPSAEAPLLEAMGLTCGYPSRTVLEGVDLRLERGSSTVVLGPNGSGKSTLLKTLSGSLGPLAGEVRIAGSKPSELTSSELARRVAFVPQEELPPFRFTVRQVVLMGRLPLSPGFFDTPADHRAAEQVMQEADCLDLADRPITEVSGGERQRALIARALAQEAPLLLLDEPTSHLDIGHQLAVIRLIRKLKSEGRSFLSAIHDLNLAAEMGDAAILLDQGGAALQGPTEEVLASPILDEAYGVEFVRFRDDSGRLRLFGRP